MKAVLSVDALADLAKVTAPILYLRASEDRLVPKRAGNVVKRLQPSTRIVEIAGPHCLLQAAPAAAAQVIREFVRFVELRPSYIARRPLPGRHGGRPRRGARVR